MSKYLDAWYGSPTGQWANSGSSSTGSGTESPHWTTATTGIMNGLANLGMAFGNVYGQISGKPPANPYEKTDDMPPPPPNNTILYLGIALVAIVLFLVFRKK